jgi:hypothetical protein
MNWQRLNNGPFYYETRWRPFYTRSLRVARLNSYIRIFANFKHTNIVKKGVKHFADYSLLTLFRSLLRNIVVQLYSWVHRARAKYCTIPKPDLAIVHNVLSKYPLEPVSPMSTQTTSFRRVQSPPPHCYLIYHGEFSYQHLCRPAKRPGEAGAGFGGDTSRL